MSHATNSVNPCETPDDLIPAPKAAKLLQLHLGNLHRWRMQGRLRAWLRGRQWFFSRAELLAQFQEQRPYQPSGPMARERRAEQQWVEETLRKHGLGRTTGAESRP